MGKIYDVRKMVIVSKKNFVNKGVNKHKNFLTVLIYLYCLLIFYNHVINTWDKKFIFNAIFSPEI